MVKKLKALLFYDKFVKSFANADAGAGKTFS